MGRPRSVRGFGLIEQLKEHANACTYVIAHVDNGDPQRISFSDVRNRVARVYGVVCKLPWVKVEMYNRRNELLAVHNRCADDDVAAGSLEEISDGPSMTGLAGNMSALMQTCCHWILRAQEVALARQQQGTATLLDAQNRTIEAQIRRFEMADAQAGEQMRAIHALNAQLIEGHVQQLRQLRAQIAEASGETESGKVLDEILPDIIRAGLRGKGDVAGKGKPNGKPNGKAHKPDSATEGD
jgi:hypothetical protein